MKKRASAIVVAMVALGLVCAPVFADELDAAQGVPEQETVLGVPAGDGQAADSAVVSQGDSDEALEAPAESDEGTEGQTTEATEPLAAESPEASEPLGDDAADVLDGTAFSADGLTYRVLSAADLTAAVTGGEPGITSVTIPATVDYEGKTYKVTEIAAGAFADFGTIAELTFAPGSNLVAIREGAFAHNGSAAPATISTLTFPASLEVVEDGAFHCIPVEHFALEDGSRLAAIPDGFLAADGADGHPGTETECKYLWDYAIKWFVDLTEPFPFTPEDAAKACDCLVSVDLGDGNSLTRIGMGAFKNQTHLTSIDFGEGSAAELTIARGAFVAAGNNGAAADAGSEELGGIDALTLPANLVELESRAFDYARVKNLVLADGCQLTEIPNGFMEVPGVGHNGRPGYSYDSENKPVFVRDAAQIGANALESISLGADNSIASIGRGAFKNQSHLTSIDFGTSVAEGLVMLDGAFVGVGNNAYLVEQGIDAELCDGIETLVLPANLVRMGEKAADENSYDRWGVFDVARVKNVVFADGCLLEEVPDNFLGVDGAAGYNGHPGSGYDSNGAAFIKDPVQIAANCLKTVSFGSGNHITSIGDGAFKNQSHMTAIDFGTSVADSLVIRNGAFVGVGNNGYLVQVGVDDELNEGIETLVLPANLCSHEEMGSWYSNVNGNWVIQTGMVTIPGLGSGVLDYARVKNLAFEDGCKLEKIPDGFLGIDETGFNGHPGGSDPLNNLAQIAANSLETISFGQNNSLTFIGRGVCFNQSHLTNIDFGTSEAELTIDYGAFIGVGNNGYLVEKGIDSELCEGIDTLMLPANLVTMENGCFDYARIKNLVLEDNSKLTRIPENFLGMSGSGNNGHPGEDATWNSTTNEYSDHHFVEDMAQIAANCLETISLGENNSLIVIDRAAFRNQSHVTSIDFGSSTTEGLSINYGAFIGVGNNAYLVEQGVDAELCEGIETLTIPANVATVQIPEPHSSTKLRFNESLEVDYSDGIEGSNTQISTLKGTVYEYVLIDGYGTPEDWAVADLTGKVAICSRGANNFSDKANAAVEAGAVATIVYGNGGSNEPGMINMLMHGYTGTEPAVFISQANGRSIKADSTPVKDAQGNVLYYKGTLKVHPDYYTYRTAEGLADGAFGYAGIKNLEFEDGFELTELLPGSFQDLDLMEELVLGESCTLTTLDGGAFSKCDELTTVDLRGSGITTIDDSLKENPKLTCVYFPETLEAVTWSRKGEEDPEGKCPFYGCGAVDELHFAASDPAGLTFDDDVLQFLADAGVVYVPGDTSDKAIKAYEDKLAAAGLTFGPDNWEIMRDRFFIDVDEPGTPGDEAGTPHYDDIMWLAAQGISTGWVDGDTGDRTFRPYANVARADMAAFLYRLAGSPSYTPTAKDRAYFSDVTASTPHAKEIWWLAKKGISAGWTERNGTHTFRPYANVARADMAAFLYRLAGSPSYKPTAAERAYFSDVTASTPHAKEIWWLARQGVSTGWTEKDGSHTFRPYESVKRCDMAAFLHRMDDKGLVPQTV